MRRLYCKKRSAGGTDRQTDKVFLQVQYTSPTTTRNLDLASGWQGKKRCNTTDSSIEFLALPNRYRYKTDDGN